MVRVAIAGGSNGIGRAIARGILGRGSHDVVIFSRNHSQDANTVVVDYADVANLRTILEIEDIHTVICAISFQTEDGAQAQINLIEAADQSLCTKRFMPSEFGIVYKQKYLMSLPVYAGKFRAVERLEASSLEYTQFSNGMFMDYWFAPFIPSAFSINVPNWVDLAANCASIPGDGNQHIVLTSSRDVGHFVAAALELPQWEKRMHAVGDRLTINEFVRNAENLKGIEFEKHYDGIEKLKQGEYTVTPTLRTHLPEGFPISLVRAMMADAGIRVADGDLDLPEETALNKMFPELETLKVRDAIKLWVDRQI